MIDIETVERALEDNLHHAAIGYIRSMIAKWEESGVATVREIEAIVSTIASSDLRNGSNCMSELRRINGWLSASLSDQEIDAEDARWVISPLAIAIEQDGANTAYAELVALKEMMGDGETTLCNRQEAEEIIANVIRRKFPKAFSKYGEFIRIDEMVKKVLSKVRITRINDQTHYVINEEEIECLI